MQVLFIYTNVNVRGGHAGGQVAMQLGIASISAVLKSRGHDCELLVITQPDGLAKAEQKIRDVQPDVLAYTAVATQFQHVADLSRQLRQAHPDLFQICGGPHVTLVPEAALAAGGFDAVCVGEGEYPMLELLEHLAAGTDPTGIENLYFQGPDGQVRANALRPFMADLDALPPLDRDLFADVIDLDTYPHCIMTTRGCPFDCTYCCNHAFKKLAEGKYVRSRSAGNVMAEVHALQQRFPRLNYIYIEDEATGLNRAVWDELLPQLKQTGLRFGTNYRIGTTKPEFLDRLADAHFVQLNIGIESGNEWVRTNVLNRRYTNEQILDIFGRARSLKIKTKAYNLIGLPHETPEMFEDTIRINREARPDRPKVYIFYPYPGTRLDAVCDELGLKHATDGDAIAERTDSILDLPDFPREKIMAYFRSWKLQTRHGLWAGVKRTWRALTPG